MFKEKLIIAMLSALMGIIAGIVCLSIFIFIDAVMPEYPIISCIIAFILIFLCLTCLHYNDK